MEEKTQMEPSESLVTDENSIMKVKDDIEVEIRKKSSQKHNSSKVYPLYTANVVSFVTYHWLTQFAITVYKQGEVLEENLWQIHDKDTCSTNGEKLERLWQSEIRQRGQESASILRILWKFSWRKIVAGTIIVLSSLACGLVVPTVLVREILMYNKNQDTRLWYGLLLVLLYFIMEILHRVMFAFSWALGYQIGIRVRSALAAILYNKLLRMHTLRDKSIGQIINMFMSDLGRISEAVTLVQFVLQGPVTALVVIIYCVLYMGPWALVGAIIILAFYPYQLLLSKVIVMLRRKAVVVTDSRIRLMTEILTHIKLIKLYCWEKSFVKSITGLRAREFRILRKAGFIQTMSSSVSVLVPVLAGVLMFIAHTLSGNDLNPEQPFVVLGVLYIVRPKIALTSLIVKTFSDSLVAFKRIKAILVMRETLPITSLPSPTDPTIAVEITNGTFAWESMPDLSNQKLKTNLKLTNGKTPNSHKKSARNQVNHSEVLSENNHSPSNKEDLLTDETDLIEVLHDINIKVMKGELCGVCGSVGSGKSSLMSAIMGQIEKLSGVVCVSGQMAYVPQQAWILNTTLKNNILFDLPYNKTRYEAVLNQCCLLTDLDILPARDETEIGERGINLSGGQKQRISLARAVYADQDIYLLDDPLSAVDAHVAQHLFDNCLNGALKHKTVVLVTHQLQYLRRCNHVLYMKSGQIVGSDSHSALMLYNPEYALLINTYTDSSEKDECSTTEENNTDELSKTEENNTNIDMNYRNKNNNSNEEEHQATHKALMEVEKPDQDNNHLQKGRLIEKEEVSKGTVTTATYRAYARAAGGYVVYILVLSTFLLPVASAAFTNWWLSYWVNQGSGNVSITVNNETVISTSLGDNPEFMFYILIYSVSALCMVICLLIRGGAYISTALRASSNLHNTVFAKVLRSPMSFYDTTPVGRTINRFSKDMDDVDVKLPQRSEIFFSLVCNCLVSLVMVCIVFPWFLIAMVLVGVLFFLAFRFYHVVLREVKRVDNVTRSPISSCLTTTLQGLSMVHAYNKQAEFKTRFEEAYDANTVTLQTFYFCNRWLSCRLDIITTCLTTVAALLVVLTNQTETAFAGLALVYSSQVSGIAQFAVRLASETEALFTSVERIQHYIKNVCTEADTIIPNRRPPSEWPAHGAISFCDYSMRYRPGLPLVLNNINCDIKPRENVGIVGRTGSGKSSLGVGLFRLVEAASGSISIDGVAISSIGLEDLRSKLFIIPQDPVMFAGSVRTNLDPFDWYSDLDLWQALARCHVKDKVESLPGGLSASVGDSGVNFSVGERQLICLARALLRNAKILILDEATAAIDTETDAHIQTTIREAFTDCTMLTIAHRLHTVLSYDKILVVDNGQIAEFDTPAALLDQPNSHLSALVQAADITQPHGSS